MAGGWFGLFQPQNVAVCFQRLTFGGKTTIRKMNIPHDPIFCQNVLYNKNLFNNCPGLIFYIGKNVPLLSETTGNEGRLTAH